VVHDLLDELRRLGEDQAPDRHVVEQAPIGVDHVDHVRRLGLAATATDVLERARDRPVGLHGQVVGGHQAPDAVFGVAQQLARLRQVLRIEQVQQPLRDPARQLLQQGGAVVGVQVGEEPPRLGIGQFTQEVVAGAALEIGEHLGRHALWKGAEEQHPVGRVELVQDVDELGRDELLVRPVDTTRRQLGPAPITDVGLQLGRQDERVVVQRACFAHLVHGSVSSRRGMVVAWTPAARRPTRGRDLARGPVTRDGQPAGSSRSGRRQRLLARSGVSHGARPRFAMRRRTPRSRTRAGSAHVASQRRGRGPQVHVGRSRPPTRRSIGFRWQARIVVQRRLLSQKWWPEYGVRSAPRDHICPVRSPALARRWFRARRTSRWEGR
jgi:hypothetical protein